MAKEVLAPNKYGPEGYKVFLGGAIDQGTAEDWQSRVVDALADVDVVVLNPRREDWDSS